MSLAIFIAFGGTAAALFKRAAKPNELTCACWALMFSSAWIVFMSRPRECAAGFAIQPIANQSIATQPIAAQWLSCNGLSCNGLRQLQWTETVSVHCNWLSALQFMQRIANSYYWDAMDRVVVDRVAIGWIAISLVANCNVLKCNVLRCNVLSCNELRCNGLRYNAWAELQWAKLQWAELQWAELQNGQPVAYFGFHKGGKFSLATSSYTKEPNYFSYGQYWIFLAKQEGTPKQNATAGSTFTGDMQNECRFDRSLNRTIKRSYPTKQMARKRLCVHYPITLSTPHICRLLSAI